MKAGDPFNPFDPPASAQHVSVPDGEVFVWQPYPTIVLEKARGVMSRALAESLEGLCRRMLSPGVHYRIFADFEELAGYTRDARELQTTFTLDNLDAFEAVHVLFSSRDLALGIAVYKHDVGDELVYTYAERGSLVRSYEQAVRDLLH